MMAMKAGPRLPACPMCPGYGVPLGTLGAVHWFRCRHCGWNFGRRRRARPRPTATTREGARDAPVLDHKPA